MWSAPGFISQLWLISQRHGLLFLTSNYSFCLSELLLLRRQGWQHWKYEEVGGNGVVGWRWYNNFSLNSLAPGKFKWNFRHVIFKQILVIDGWGSSCEIALIWIWLNFTDDQSTLVQVMAWCHQATSHYLSQCWPRSLSLYGITRPQWYNLNSTTQSHILGFSLYDTVFYNQSLCFTFT